MMVVTQVVIYILPPFHKIHSELQIVLTQIFVDFSYSATLLIMLCKKMIYFWIQQTEKIYYVIHKDI